MPALPISATGDHTISKRVVKNDDGDYSIPRILGIIFVVLALLVILYFGARNVRRRRGRRLYNTRRNQGPVRVQRLEGRGGNRSGGGGERLPAWSERLSHPRVSPMADGEELPPPPPVYKRQDDLVVQRDPPPPYMGPEEPS